MQRVFAVALPVLSTPLLLACSEPVRPPGPAATTAAPAAAATAADGFTIRSLGTLGGPNGGANDINDASHVVAGRNSARDSTTLSCGRRGAGC